jgi:hypothetical protein
MLEPRNSQYLRETSRKALNLRADSFGTRRVYDLYMHPNSPDPRLDLDAMEALAVRVRGAATPADLATTQTLCSHVIELVAAIRTFAETVAELMEDDEDEDDDDPPSGVRFTVGDEDD